MFDIVLLLAWSLAIGTLGSRFASCQHLLERYPRLGITLWLSAAISVMVSAVLAAGLLVLDSAAVRESVSGLLRACMTGLRQHYAEVPVSALAGLLTLIVLSTWLSYNAVIGSVRAARVRQRHRTILDLISPTAAQHEVAYVKHPRASVYCVPGRGGRIVVTTTAAAELTSDQLAAVIEHERAHLYGRHHLLTGAVGYLCAALPFVPLMQQAGAAVSYLIERVADQRACRVVDSQTLVLAMLAIGTTQAPAATLGVGGSTVVRRALVLSEPQAPPKWVAAIAVGATVALLAIPLALGLAPAVGWSWHDHCFMAA